MLFLLLVSSESTKLYHQPPPPSLEKSELQLREILTSAVLKPDFKVHNNRMILK